MLKRISTALLMGLASQTAMAGGGDPAPAPAPAGNNHFIPQGEVSFIAIGDTGTGDEKQHKVAKAMEKLCQVKRCEFAIGLGDNIYEVGVDSSVDDQFNTKFEQPYANLDFPFYMALGNHDNSGSTVLSIGFDNDAGEHQVAYSHRPDRPSSKWNMPARYYSFVPPAASPNERALVQFYAVDSNPMVQPDLDPEYETFSYRHRHEHWMEDQENSKTGYWRIGFAHHPYISNGSHGNAGIYDRLPLAGISYRDFIRNTVCDKMDFFITGHDHDLQWLKPTDSCGQTEHIISGAGAKTRALSNRTRNDARFQDENILGFFWINIKGNQLTAEAYTPTDNNGNYRRLYANTVTKKVGEVGDTVSQYARLRTERGFCLEAPNTNNGTEVIAAECNHTDKQYWKMDNNGFVRSMLNNNKCLDGRPSNGNPAVIWDCSNVNWHKWGWNNANLKNRHHSGVLDMFGSNAGDKVGVWNLHNGDNQRWQWR